jgi:hypothetical protein
MPYVMEIAAEPVPFTERSHTRHMVDLIQGRVRMRYLKSFDPEAFDGRGQVIMTDNLREALRFRTIEEVMALWNTQSATVPYRHDGKPNKPLTAFSVSPREVEPRTGRFA